MNAQTPAPACYSFGEKLPYLITMVGAALLIFGSFTDPIPRTIMGFFGIFMFMGGLLWGLVRDWRRKPYCWLNQLPKMWDIQYAIGNDLIDAQHRELFQRIRNLKDASSPEEFEATLNFLLEYVDVHFADEEALMGEVGYPDLPNHIKLHRELQEKAAKFKQGGDGFKNPENREAFGNLASDWLVGHIFVEDQKIVAHMKKR